MKCRNPECNADVNPKALFCGKCGTPVLANCTECGTPIPAKKTVKCCPKCGTMLSAMKKSSAKSGTSPEPASSSGSGTPLVPSSAAIKNCTKCGTLLPDKKNVKCCPKCGTMVSEMLKKAPASASAKKPPAVPPTVPSKPAKTVFCKDCGAPIPPGKSFTWCPQCGSALSEQKPKTPTRKKPVPDPAPVPAPAPSPAPVTPLSHPKPPHPVAKDPVKKMLIVALVIGLCLLWTGLGGKLIMGRCRTELNSILRNQGLNILDNAMGGVVEDLVISVIHNDVNGFTAAFNKIASTAGSMMGLSSEVFALAGGMVSAQISDQFPDFRNQMADSVSPPAWIILVVASYNRIFLILGALITFLSAVLWLIVQKGKLSDIREQKMIPAIVAGAVWCAAVTVITIIGMTIKL